MRGGYTTVDGDGLNVSASVKASVTGRGREGSGQYVANLTRVIAELITGFDQPLGNQGRTMPSDTQPRLIRDRIRRTDVSLVSYDGEKSMTVLGN
mmetsp:Transcript_18206/g.37968  ORF Transcript_18206/g.37968 Transcript_18206/m.37968 type:complete len:95 (+) Transcript_18206:1194-1478(+)